MEFIAPVLITLGFLAYWFYIRRGQIRPNTACWIMWVGLSIFRLSQFGSLPDFLGRGALILDTGGCIITLLVALLMKNSVRVATKDVNNWFVIGPFAVCLVLLRLSLVSETVASMIPAILFLTSFSPMLWPGRSLLSDSATEKLLPWLIWAASAVPDIWGQSNPFVLLNSGLAVVLQVIVAYFAFRGRQNVASRTIPTANQSAG